MYTYPAKAVANYFLQKAWSKNLDLTLLQIIKLVYIAHGWTLGILSKPLIDEEVEAWKYGPVIRSLYDEFRKYGDRPITDLAEEIETLQRAPLEIASLVVPSPKFKDNERTIVDSAFDNYCGIKGWQLSGLTHQKGTPWDEVYSQGVQNAPIADALIEKYYRRLAHQNAA